MKLPLNLPRARAAGFTLVEIVIVSVIFVFLILAIVGLQLFAARIYTLSATKLTSTASARNAMNVLREQIRGGVDPVVGMFNPATYIFTNIPEGSPQIGNSLIIYSNNPNLSTPTLGMLYFMNLTRSNICSVVWSNSAALSATLKTNFVVYITNQFVFDAEDCHTNILTTSVNNRLIHVIFKFSEWEYPMAGTVGSNAMYDYYQLQTRVAPRIINY